MKILLQLLREFWVPLLLGIAWTVFNFVDQPISQWTVRAFLNVFGPTFFFVSWLVAQWYRVKKQKRVEDGLTEIQRDVRAIHAPFLPCRVFMTLHHQATDADLDRLFAGQEGYRAFGSDRPMPPPPYGLPPGVTNGRVIHPGRFFEYRDSVLVGAGLFRQDFPAFNTIHCPVQNTVSTLSEDRTAEAVKQNEPLLSQPSVRVDLYFNGRPKSENARPSLVLTSVLDAQQVAAAHALDNNVFVDRLHQLIPEPADQPRIWTTSDLKHAYIRVTLEFFYLGQVSYLARESWPRLHNFQLWLGPKGQHVFAFTDEQLSSQVVREDPNPLMRGDAQSVQIVFEHEIDDSTYSTCLVASA